MAALICIKCPEAGFLDPKKEICYKTGGLFCKRLKRIVGKYDPCHIPSGPAPVKKRGRAKKGGRGG